MTKAASTHERHFSARCTRFWLLDSRGSRFSHDLPENCRKNAGCLTTNPLVNARLTAPYRRAHIYTHTTVGHSVFLTVPTYFLALPTSLKYQAPVRSPAPVNQLVQLEPFQRLGREFESRPSHIIWGNFSNDAHQLRATKPWVNNYRLHGR